MPLATPPVYYMSPFDALTPPLILMPMLMRSPSPDHYAADATLYCRPPAAADTPCCRWLPLPHAAAEAFAAMPLCLIA